jgi:ribose 5-phosphate isomerase B
MTISIGCDPAGYELKILLLNHLKNKSLDLIDVGCDSTKPADYPVYAQKVAKLVNSKNCERGILICGTGQGMTMSANKITGIRAALCHNEFSAILSREHNDANVLCMGSWVLKPEEAIRIVDIWLFAKFSKGESHQKRINMMDQMNAQ